MGPRSSAGPWKECWGSGVRAGERRSARGYTNSAISTAQRQRDPATRVGGWDPDHSRFGQVLNMRPARPRSKPRRAPVRSRQRSLSMMLRPVGIAGSARAPASASSPLRTAPPSAAGHGRRHLHAANLATAYVQYSCRTFWLASEKLSDSGSLGSAGKLSGCMLPHTVKTTTVPIIPYGWVWTSLSGSVR